MDAISRLLKPRSVAVIGASADASKTAGRPVSYLVKHGFSGDIYPINPKVDRIGDLACYKDVASLPAAPDVGIVLLGAERAHLAVRDLAARGTAAAIVLASGYTETGEEGARRQKQLIDAAGSMRILGPNTIGLVNLTDSIVLSATGALEMDHFPVGGSVSSRRVAASSAPSCREPRREGSDCRSSFRQATRSTSSCRISSITSPTTMPPRSSPSTSRRFAIRPSFVQRR
jgi:predicted CoA-binding protein